MSTRATYIFEDATDHYAVYKHHDGYPTGAAEHINKALKHAWQLPRFEPDEFAAAFVAANKGDGGGVRLMNGYTLMDCSGDIEYLYRIRNVSSNGMNAKITVTCYSTSFWKADSEFTRNESMTELFSCSLEDLERVAKEFEDSEAA